MKGAVLLMLADTPAAHAIGGFKVGVGFALRKCRHCMATKETMSTMVCTKNMHGHCINLFVMTLSRNSLETEIFCPEHQ